MPSSSKTATTSMFFGQKDNNISGKLNGSDSSNNNNNNNSTSNTTTTTTSSRSSGSDEKCQQCMDHLTSILMAVKSKPKILFEAMGVQTLYYNRNNIDDKKYNYFMNSGGSSSSSSSTSTQQDHQDKTERKHNSNHIFWSMDEDAKGLKLQIPRFHKESLHDNYKVNEGVDYHKAIMLNQNTKKSNEENQKMTGFGGAATAKESQNQIVSSLTDTNDSKRMNIESKSNVTILQRVKTKLRQRFQTKQLATSSSSSPLHDNTNNDNMTLEIQCRQCGNSGPEGSARAFLRGPSPLTIILCTNRLSLSDSEEIEEVLTHELIHVFDVHHRKWDFSNCQTLAKSEIRAAREAECGNISFGFWKESCVRDKAKEATRNMFPLKGIDCVNQVFKDAMYDSEPFHQKGNENGGRTTIATSYKEK